MKKLVCAAAIVLGMVVAGCGEEDIGNAPAVSGLALPEAKRVLKRAGYQTSVTDDAMFGVIVPEHFTVCKQKAPVGKLVPLEVSKAC